MFIIIWHITFSIHIKGRPCGYYNWTMMTIINYKIVHCFASAFYLFSIKQCFNKYKLHKTFFSPNCNFKYWGRHRRKKYFPTGLWVSWKSSRGALGHKFQANNPTYQVFNFTALIFPALVPIPISPLLYLLGITVWSETETN